MQIEDVIGQAMVALGTIETCASCSKTRSRRQLMCVWKDQVYWCGYEKLLSYISMKCGVALNWDNSVKGIHIER